MANGDAAAAAGLTTVPGTADRRLGYDAINYSLDRIVTRVFDTAQIADNAITTAKIAASAVTDAKIAAVAASKLTGTITRPINTTSGSGIIANNADINANGGNLLGSGITTTGDAHIGGTTNVVTLSASGPIYSPHGRANGVSGGLTAYLGADGRLAVSASSRRFKKNIAVWSPDLQAVLALELVQFHWKAAYDNLGGAWDQGLIAEQVADLGLEWLIWRDDEGQPAGVRYERIALALLPVVQNHEARLAALEARP